MKTTDAKFPWYEPIQSLAWNFSTDFRGRIQFMDLAARFRVGVPDRAMLGLVHTVAHRQIHGVVDLSFYKLLWHRNLPGDMPRKREQFCFEGNGGVFAVVEVDSEEPDKPCKYPVVVTFSPVPFGTNGKPMLPEGLPRQFVDVALSWEGTGAWSCGKIVSMVQAMGGGEYELGKVFNGPLVLMERMGIIRSNPSKGSYEDERFETAMTSDEFERIFGKLF